MSVLVLSQEPDHEEVLPARDSESVQPLSTGSVPIQRQEATISYLASQARSQRSLTGLRSDHLTAQDLDACSVSSVSSCMKWGQLHSWQEEGTRGHREV